MKIFSFTMIAILNLFASPQLYSHPYYIDPFTNTNSQVSNWSLKCPTGYFIIESGWSGFKMLHTTNFEYNVTTKQYFISGNNGVGICELNQNTQEMRCNYHFNFTVVTTNKNVFTNSNSATTFNNAVSCSSDILAAFNAANPNPDSIIPLGQNLNNSCDPDGILVIPSPFSNNVLSCFNAN